MQCPWTVKFLLAVPVVRNGMLPLRPWVKSLRCDIRVQADTVLRYECVPWYLAPKLGGHKRRDRTGWKGGAPEVRLGAILHSSDVHSYKQKFLFTLIPSQNRSSFLSEHTK